MGLHLLSLCGGAQYGDHGLQGQDAAFIQVCSTHLFDHLSQFVIEANVIFFFKMPEALLCQWDLRVKTSMLGWN